MVYIILTFLSYTCSLFKKEKKKKVYGVTSVDYSK